jgi:peptidyl-tRNA hydrolase
MYIAVRSDLSQGAQFAQSNHATAQFAAEHPAVHQQWYRNSNWLIVLTVPDEAQLFVLESMALTLGLKHSLVREPDMGDVATAIALEPGPMTRRLCAQYPCAGKELAVT